jgi:hypothetical protein
MKILKEEKKMSTNNLPLRIDRSVQQAILDYACKHRISPLYAAHCNLVKSLHSEGFLGEDDYQRLLSKFSSKLVQEVAKPVSLEQKQNMQHLEAMKRTFSAVLQEWDNPLRPQSWREGHIRQADKYKDEIPEAKRLLEKIACKVFVK